MKRPAFITTSWDDGNTADLRVAEILNRHGLKGTFYVPRASFKPVVSEAEIRALSRDHDIGSHTLHHVDLLRTPAEKLQMELTDSKKWIEDLTARPCSVFCPPRGRYATQHLPMIEQAGYRAIRNVELLSTAFPQNQSNLLIMATTVQAYPHSMGNYLRNVIKRRSPWGLWLALSSGRSRDWTSLGRKILENVRSHGGVFHLWGHSWEIEANNLWQPLEQFARFLGEYTASIPAVTNGELIQRMDRTDEMLELNGLVTEKGIDTGQPLTTNAVGASLNSFITMGDCVG